MYLASSPSPTLSGTSSPFHPLSYHASSRRSFPPSSPSPRITHTPQSPRFPAPVSASRRAEGHFPPTHFREQGERLADQKEVTEPGKNTVDAGTQYTPPGFPPTHKPFPLHAADEALEKRTYTSSGETSEQRSSSASGKPITTAEPLEPGVRVTPQQHPSNTSDGNPSKSTATALAETLSKSSVVDIREHSSPSKKARPHEPDAKVMPLKYETCDINDLGVLVSDMLMELVRLNDKIPLKDGQLTRFHSRAPPIISVRDYLHRLIVHATLSPPILLSMVYYVDRLCALYPAFTISSLTVHRFLITAATVAAKGLSDSFWTNSTYARVGGVSTKELALLELEFLRRLEWRIVPKPEVLVDYYRGLVERGQGYSLEEEEASNHDDTDSGSHSFLQTSGSSAEKEP